VTYDFGDVDDHTRAVMEANPPEGTGPEETAAAALDELGVGYEEQPSYGRYRPDFRLEDGTVLQIMGCWWHGCPCAHSMDDVGTNEDYWSEKLRTNRERDRRRRRELLADHGAPLVFWVWEHDDVAERVAALCAARGLP
jgi:DNA mismatch endonuclease (patch repair protein)